MSTALIVETAVAAKYAALTFTPKPDFYADKAPLKDTGGTALATPYVVLTTEDAGIDEWLSDLDRIEAVNVSLEVYAVSGATAQAICLGIQFDGGDPMDRLGLDDSTETNFTLPSGYRLNLCERVGPTIVEQLTERDVNSTLLYLATLRYRVQIYITGDGR